MTEHAVCQENSTKTSRRRDLQIPVLQGQVQHTFLKIVSKDRPMHSYTAAGLELLHQATAARRKPGQAGGLVKGLRIAMQFSGLLISDSTKRPVYVRLANSSSGG